MKQVWIIDDDEDLRNAIQQMIRMLGYECQSFRDARQAGRALLDGNIPDLLFVDINMPRVSGLDFLEFVRSRDAWTNLPVLMLTSESSDEVVEKAIRLGADGYVFKPVNFEELEMAISSAIRRRKIVTGQLGKKPET